MTYIHRIWLDDPMPSIFDGFGRRWAALHPDWELIDWTDSSELPGLTNQVAWNKAKTLFPNDWKRYQSDLLRLELLYQQGGLYVDTDVEPHINIQPLIEGESCVVVRAPQHIKGDFPLTNWFIYAEPSHPFIEDCIDEFPISAAKYAKSPLSRATGPWLLTRVYRAGDYDMKVIEVDGWQPYLTHHYNNKKRKKGRGLG